MTTNKPEVIYLIDTGDGTVWCDDPDPMGCGGYSDTVKYVRGDAYEALQAECDALRAKTSLSLGVGDGTGNLFVHGDYESIKRVQALIFARNYGKTSPSRETNTEKPKYLWGQRVIVDNNTIATFRHYENENICTEQIWVELPNGLIQWRAPHNVKPLPGGQL